MLKLNVFSTPDSDWLVDNIIPRYRQILKYFFNIQHQYPYSQGIYRLIITVLTVLSSRKDQLAVFKDLQELVRLFSLFLADGAAVRPEEVPEVHRVDGRARLLVELQTQTGKQTL